MRNLSRAGTSAGRIAGERAMQDARRRASTKLSRQTSSSRTSSRLSSSQTKSADRSSILGTGSFAKKYQSSTENSALEKTYYTQMGESAESLQDRASMFLKQKESTLSESEHDKMITEIEDFIDDYNTMRKSMEYLGGQVRQIYIQQLDKQTTKREKALEEVGITKEKNGTLSIKTSVLKEADIEKVKALFCSVDSFADSVSDISNAVEKNARDHLYEFKFSSYSSNYSRTGSYYDSYTSSTGKRYNVRG